MFFKRIPLPDYLEDALKPFEWSGVFSSKFRDDITHAVLADKDSRMVLTDRLADSINLLEFLSSAFRVKLIGALKKFGREGFPKT